MTAKKDKKGVIVYADKTVLRISGLAIKGLDTRQIEDILARRLQSTVRVIGVTGDAIDMDVYGVSAENLLQDEEGILKAAALAEGITLTDLARIAGADKIVDVDFSKIPQTPRAACARERWL